MRPRALLSREPSPPFGTQPDIALGSLLLILSPLHSSFAAIAATLLLELLDPLLLQLLLVHGQVGGVYQVVVRQLLE